MLTRKVTHGSPFMVLSGETTSCSLINASATSGEFFFMPTEIWCHIHRRSYRIKSKECSRRWHTQCKDVRLQ